MSFLHRKSLKWLYPKKKNEFAVKRLNKICVNVAREKIENSSQTYAKNFQNNENKITDIKQPVENSCKIKLQNLSSSLNTKISEIKISSWVIWSIKKG